MFTNQKYIIKRNKLLTYIIKENMVYKLIKEFLSKPSRKNSDTKKVTHIDRTWSLGLLEVIVIEKIVIKGIGTF